MIQTELLEKNSIAHCFLSSSTNPNILIPVKVFIKDVKFYESNPRYLVKVMQFYDSIHFLKKYFINRPFVNKFDARSRILTFPKRDFKTSTEVLNYMQESQTDKYLFVVESINIVKYKIELESLFNKIQDFLIMKSMKEWRDNSVRHLYSGKFKMSSKTDFHIRLKSMIGDKVSKTGEDFDNFIDLIL